MSDKDLLNEFIKFAKEQYGREIILEPSDKPDTFESIYGTSFLNSKEE